MDKIVLNVQNEEVGVITLKEILDLINEDRRLRGSKDIQHSKAMAIVSKMSAESPSFGEVSFFDTINLNKVKFQTYMLTKNQAIAVGGKLDTERLMMVIRKVDEIEKRNSIPQLPQNYIEALEALTLSEKEKLLLSDTIVKKDEIILTVAELNIKAGDVSFADFAKNLAIENMGRNNVVKFCKAKGYLQLSTAPYQPFVNRGYFVRKPSREKIHGETRYTTFLTPKGSVWLARVIRAEYELD